MCLPQRKYVQTNEKELFIETFFKHVKHAFLMQIQSPETKKKSILSLVIAPKRSSTYIMDSNCFYRNHLF